MRAHTSTADQAPWCTSGRPRTSGDCHTKPPPQLIPHKNPSPAGEKRTHIASGQQNAAVARKCCQVASAVASCSGCAIARSKGRGSPCDPGLHLVGGGLRRWKRRRRKRRRRRRRRQQLGSATCVRICVCDTQAARKKLTATRHRHARTHLPPFYARTHAGAVIGWRGTHVVCKEEHFSPCPDLKQGSEKPRSEKESSETCQPTRKLTRACFCICQINALVRHQVRFFFPT